MPVRGRVTGGGAYEAVHTMLTLLVCIVCQYVYKRVALVDWGLEIKGRNCGQKRSYHPVLTPLAARGAALERLLQALQL